MLTVFLAFAACGAASRFVYTPDGWRNWVGFPLPFGLLCALMVLRARIPIFVVLCAVVWNAAFQSTMLLNTRVPDAVSFFAGGFIGGAGLLLSSSVSKPAMWSWRNLAMCGVAGGLAGLSFAAPALFAENLSGPFAVWQGVVGTLLYWTHRQSLELT
jgi:hypothetical protein